MHSVLFVCTANICRSPMAMGLLQGIVYDTIVDWRIESAGTWAIEGQPAARFTQQVLLTRGIDLRNHRSRLVSNPMMEQFNLILAMESGHKEALKVEFPFASKKIFTVSQMIDQVFDIIDPIGGPLLDFEATARELTQIIQKGFGKIEMLSSAKNS
jgi:protein arginine phosphatase